MESTEQNKSICFLCHAFHRGGVTRWMIDAAVEYAGRGWITWFVTIKPSGFISRGTRPSMWELLSVHSKIKLIASSKNKSFELGTLKGRSFHYAYEISKNVPPGTPVILSDDESVWLAGKIISNVYPVIGVLHSDDEVYYSLYQKYHSYLSAAVAVSERIKNKALKLTDQNLISVIPCGILLPELNNTSPDNLLRVVWAGRIEERQKRVSDIPKIAQGLHNSGIQYHWVVAGHGDETLLTDELSLQRLEAFFCFTGWISRDELNRIMDNSDLMVLPSNFEGMPVVIMEALAKGLAVVSSRVSGVEDLVQDELAENSMRLYDIGNIEQAVNAIKDISDISREKRIKASRDLAEKYYSIQSCVDHYNLVIDKISFTPGKLYFHSIKRLLFIEKMKSIFLSNMRYLKYKVSQDLNRK